MSGDMLYRPRFTRSGEPYMYPEGHDYGFEQPDRSFDEDWQLGAAMADRPVIEDQVGLDLGRHEVEHVIETRSTLRSMGRREWTETVEVEVYRNVIPVLDDFALWLSTHGRRS